MKSRVICRRQPTSTSPGVSHARTRMDAATDAARQEADGVAAQAQADISKSSVPAHRGADCANQSDAARLGAVLCSGSLEPLFLVHSRLGREENSAPAGARQPASRFRV